MVASGAMIEEGSRVSIEYTLTLDDGSVADSNVGGEALTYEQGTGQILPALERELLGLTTDDVRKVSLAATDGYGEVDPEAFQNVDPGLVPEEARKVGTTLVAQDNTGGQRPVRVAEVHDDRVVIDFNHPLAGQNLHFEIKIVAVA